MRMLTPAVVSIALAGAPAHALTDDAHREMGREMADRARAWLISQQHESGGWHVRDDGPVFPAITGLALSGILFEAESGDPAVSKAVDFLVSHQQPDGGIYDRILPSYNTAIAVSALAKANTPNAQAALPKAKAFLRGLQYSERSVIEGPAGGTVQRVDEAHPFYGGVGYGGHGRPDLSNLSFFVQAMHDMGVEGSDPAMKRAVVFLERVQMHGEINDMAYAEGSKQGGFIYATGPSGEEMGEGESKAGMIEESMDDGTRVSRLRAYGSMTYAGFKSYLYADLAKDDVRVQAALDWMTQNYSLDENPGLGEEGLYYYFVTFARALQAFGEPTLDVATPDGAATRDWGNDLIDRLAKLQEPSGAFRSVNERWMESNQVLITAYALIALEHAIDAPAGASVD